MQEEDAIRNRDAEAERAEAAGETGEAQGEAQDSLSGAETAGEAAGEPAAEALEARLAEAERQRDEYLDIAQRIKAEFENYRRRTNAVRAEAWEDGACETVALLLPVIDNLERALGASPEKNPLRDGVEMVYRQTLDVLEKRGVTPFARTGEVFDPALEDAVAQAGAEEGEPGTVCQVLLTGYKTRSRVLRHAMVRVVASE